VIQLCETYGVQQCIFSSTGKASRYFTNDVYAGSKKLAEWLFAQAAQQGRVKYGMVRFTHIIEIV
jgi:FlaA1/EpsC-like NDP-sugar epimerase